MASLSDITKKLTITHNPDRAFTFDEIEIKTNDHLAICWGAKSVADPIEYICNSHNAFIDMGIDLDLTRFYDVDIAKVIHREIGGRLISGFHPKEGFREFNNQITYQKQPIYLTAFRGPYYRAKETLSLYANIFSWAQVSNYQLVTTDWDKLSKEILKEIMYIKLKESGI